MSWSLFNSVLRCYKTTTKFLEKEFWSWFYFWDWWQQGDNLYWKWNQINNLRKHCKSTHQHSIKHPPSLSQLCPCNCTINASLVSTSSYIRILQQAECRYAPIFSAHSTSSFLSVSNILLVLCLLLLFSFCCYTAPLKIAV